MRGVPTHNTSSAGHLHRGKEQVYSVTAADYGHAVDLHSREVRYLISMGIRTACFVIAVVTSGWVRYIAFAAAVVLPYFAVVAANAARRRSGTEPTPVTPPTPRELER